MADFCYQCSIELFGEDYKDFAGICEEGWITSVLCEGCGTQVFVDHKGVCVDKECPKHRTPLRI